MNTRELINRVVAASNLNENDVLLAFYALMHVVTVMLHRDGEVSVPCLGSFELKERRPCGDEGGRTVLFTPEPGFLAAWKSRRGAERSRPGATEVVPDTGQERRKRPRVARYEKEND